MVFALCACGQQGAEGKDPAAKLPEFKLGIPMENTANPAQYSYLENMVYLCGNFPNGGTAVAEADDLTDPDHMISSVEKLISAGCNMITICPLQRHYAHQGCKALRREQGLLGSCMARHPRPRGA